MSDPGDAVARFIAMLRERRRVPVNYVSADETIDRLAIDDGDPVERQLDALAASTPAYRWSEIAGRRVVFPKAAVWETRIRGVAIAGTPRLEAARLVVALVRTEVLELADLSEPPMIGDPRSPVYSDSVSLPREGSIVQCLVALLGADPGTFFTIERTKFGDRLLHFDRMLG